MENDLFGSAFPGRARGTEPINDFKKMRMKSI